MRRSGFILAGLCLLCACVSGSRTKGGLEPIASITPGEVDRALGHKRLALLVGIDRFSDERWPSLKHSRTDASALGEILKDPERGRFDQVTVLSDPEGVRLVQIQNALRKLETENTSTEDTVLVYFSTHGTLARGPDGVLSRYLVTSDSRQGTIRESALRVRDLLESFERLPSARKVMILASCHSGSGKSALPQTLASELTGIKGAFFVRPLEETSQASMVLTACAWGETAREDDKLGHDIYTHFLIEALRDLDDDGDGAVTASEAHAYAMSHTYYYSEGRQRPQVESTILGKDPIVLAGQRLLPADPVLYSFLPGMEGMRVSIDGRDKGELPKRLVVPAGTHRVKVTTAPDQPPLLDDVVHLETGDRIAIEELIEDVKPHWVFSTRGGYQHFFDENARNEWIGPSPLFGLYFARLEFPGKNWETGVDFNLGGGSQRVKTGGLDDPDGSGLLELAYGLRMLYRFDLDPVNLLVGPRIAGVNVFRNIRDAEGKTHKYHFFNMSPGMVILMRLKIWSVLSLDLELRAQFFSVHTDTKVLDLTYLDLFGGLGWSF